MFGLGIFQIIVVMIIPVAGLALLVFLLSLALRYVKAIEKIANKSDKS